MNIPDQLKIHASIDNIPVEGLIIDVCLRVDCKNDFTSLHGPTDIDGDLTISKAVLLERALAEKKMFLMDYADPEGNFIGIIEITKCSQLELQRALDAYFKFEGVFDYPSGYREMLEEGLKSQQNFNFSNVDINCTSTDNDVQIHIK